MNKRLLFTAAVRLVNKINIILSITYARKGSKCGWKIFYLIILLKGPSFRVIKRALKYTLPRMWQENRKKQSSHENKVFTPFTFYRFIYRYRAVGEQTSSVSHCEKNQMSPNGGTSDYAKALSQSVIYFNKRIKKKLEIFFSLVNDENSPRRPPRLTSRA